MCARQNAYNSLRFSALSLAIDTSSITDFAVTERSARTQNRQVCDQWTLTVVRN
jgi:hypothetical protein